MQIDNPKRGFSFKVDGPLDLRLNQETGISAAERLDTISREELAGMLDENSDEPYCEEIAKAITDEIRRGNHIDTTTKLREVIEKTLVFSEELTDYYTLYQLLLFHFQEKRVDEFFELIEENRSKVNHYFQTVFRTFLRHKQYIKNALETDYSNAKLEATNKLIKDTKRLGFGFRNFINFKKRVFITLNIHKKRTYPVLSRC